MWNRDEDDTIWPTNGTPTPNDMRSNHDILPRRSLDMLVGLTPMTGTKTNRQVSGEFHITLKGKESNIWECGETHNHICIQRVLSGGGNWLHGDLFSNRNILLNHIYSITLSVDGMEYTSNGCEDNIPWWGDWGRVVHSATKRIRDLQRRVKCVQTQESIIWIETSTMCLVHQDCQLFHQVGLHQKWSRWKHLAFVVEGKLFIIVLCVNDLFLIGDEKRG